MKHQNRTNRLLRVLFSLLALALIAAACSSDDGAAAPGTDTEAATEAEDTIEAEDTTDADSTE